MDISKILISLLVVIIDVARGYEVGLGRADVTGPIVDVPLMGYGRFDQVGSGLHMRQWARSFIISDGKSRVVFVSVDAGMMGDGVRIQVLKALQKKFGAVYNSNNVIISATHTHSAVGGFLMHTLFDLPTMGFCRETFDSLVSGIVKSIEKAHQNLQKGRVFLKTDTVLGVSVNRSPTSYLENPKEERAKYKYDTDKELIQLKFEDLKGKTLGVLNWYPIHGTTLNYTNHFVSGDNIGYAAVGLETLSSNNSLAGKSDFVAAFASSNLGDVSPNVVGPKCHQSGTQCDRYSKCADLFEECYATGNGKDMYDSLEKTGNKLIEAAYNLVNKKTGFELLGPVQAIHQYVDMPSATARVLNRTTGKLELVSGCSPAMGYSAGAGTTDGQFLPFVHQGMKNSTWWIDMVTQLVSRPTKDDIQCHAPKPILLMSGSMRYPFDWQPRIVSTQLARIGNLSIVCVPGEFTTMSGRRAREAVKAVLGNDTTVVIAGLCNTYSDYITTFEEYQAQRYEAGSTLYGPHTLSLYLAQFEKLATALKQNKNLNAGPEPEGLNPDEMVSFTPPVVFDEPKSGRKFGDVLYQPNNATSNQTTLKFTFVAASPRNNLKLDNSYFLIEQQVKDGYVPFANDADPNTKLHWRRTDADLGTSEVDIYWEPKNVYKAGYFRVRYFGDSKNKDGKIVPFVGETKPFLVPARGGKDGRRVRIGKVGSRRGEAEKKARLFI